MFSKKGERRTACVGWKGGEGGRRSLTNTVQFYRTASHPWTATWSALPLSSAAPGSRSWLLARCCGDRPTLGDERQLPVQHHVTASGTKTRPEFQQAQTGSAHVHTQTNKHRPPTPPPPCKATARSRVFLG